MRKILFAAVMMSLALALSGCGGSDHRSHPIVTHILSDAAVDGDIQLDPVTNQLTVAQGTTPSVFAGIDPGIGFGAGPEYRAFLDFPLTGAGGVPGNAIIDSATLDIFIDSILIRTEASSIPIRIELVAFSPLTLQPSYFYRASLPPLAFTTINPPISRADIGHHVTVDVTSLMVEAQHRGLADFQVRILEDDGFAFPGLIEIHEATIDKAPLLTVSYF